MYHSDVTEDGIIFHKSFGSSDSVKVIFEDYIIKPFDGFTFHEQWNNNIPPYAKVMYGKKTKETKGMFYFELHSDISDKVWSGWCPKKSCIVIDM